MSQPRLKASFFVHPSGEIFLKSEPISERKRFEIFDRDKGKCQECGRDVVRFNMHCRFGDQPAAVDHIFPIARGGQGDDSNLRLLCRKCNSSKGAR